MSGPETGSYCPFMRGNKCLYEECTMYDQEDCRCAISNFLINGLDGIEDYLDDLYNATLALQRVQGGG